MYMLIAIAVTILVIALAWRGLGARTPRSGTPPPSSFDRPVRPPRPTRPVAPDDDPEFLSEIDRRMRGEDKNG
jgi:hypothetical protein